jgi:hypothetical protein
MLRTQPLSLRQLGQYVLLSAILLLVLTGFQLANEMHTSHSSDKAKADRRFLKIDDCER